MPTIDAIHESLPYIDPEPTPSERAAAEALIAAERLTVPDDPHHALLPAPLAPRHLTPLLAAELARVEAGTPLVGGIDLAPYQALDAPPADADMAQLEAALRRAAAAQAYVAGRRAHLALLDSWGKNAWLVGNWQLEGELRGVERELAETKRAVDVVNLARKRAQDAVGAEMQGLEETWRRGVGRVLETEAAVEGLRREVVEARRRGAA